ncbi:MAG: DUF4105 domain-containing protein, partial [Pseudomonadota bacterium]
MPLRFIAAALVLWLSAICSPLSAAAEAPEPLSAIATSESWQILGRWKNSMWPRKGQRSDIITEAFFLAENGRNDPLAELQATLQALNEPIGTDTEDHAVCRYPGRAIFLRQQGFAIPDPALYCPDFLEFTDNGATDSVSALFISGYLSNPGSAFGHILLRLHAKGDAEPREDVLDRAINYGAASSEDDALIPYIAKGLVGGYRSTYTSLQFFHQAER